MIFRPLPYPGYTWSFSQHAAGFDEATILGMLRCAFPYQGQTNVGPRITDLMVKVDLLTANQRDGKPDAWRDYQQILAELGLIVSAKLSPTLILTDISKNFVAGELPFQQMMSMQVLRYQYPNGQKHDRSTALKRSLEQSGITVPDSLIELHINSGVLVKPALLVLQILLGLFDHDEDPVISSDECRTILVPCKTNSDWSLAVGDIQSARLQGIDLSTQYSDKRLRRNIQDWFKLLGVTGLFDTDGKSFVKLSNFAKSKVGDLRDICAQESQPSSYWLPLGHSNEDRLTWFKHYGGYDFAFEALVLGDTAEIELFKGQSEQVDTEGDETPTVTGPVRLTDFDKNKLFIKDAPDLSGSVDDLAQNVRDGAMKRHAKSVLHDQIVLRYAERFQAQGAEVKVDPNSVDLFVRWSPNETAIFEVKTVSQRSLPNRMRLAVGQVKEYAFRINREIGLDPDQAIIIDRPILPNGWQKEFLNDYMGIGVVCLSGSNETIFAPNECSTSPRWHGGATSHS